jgi:SAM-dependent MidA family methyltransferase
MDLCLYHPQYGYYAREPMQVGRSGDFFTSVSCGPLFGKLIACHIAAWWRESGVSGSWRIIEPGANNGDLARDVLTHLRENEPAAFARLSYVTIDPMPVPRQFQERALVEFATHVSCLSDATALEPLPTFVIANEVLDAFPCRVIEWQQGAWQEVCVESAAMEEPLREVKRPYLGALPECLRDGNFSEGYRTEMRDSSAAFFAELRRGMSVGRMLFFDYGFAEAEYYDAQRSRGTLRVFRTHQASEDAYGHPGGCDITAHVNFTAVWHDARSLGMALRRFEPQEFFLSRLAMPLLQQGQWQDGWQNNFQTLVHPAHLGGKFHVLELSVGDDLGDDATALRRLV